jgi:hypothetical protein
MEDFRIGSLFISHAVIENSQIAATEENYAACCPLAGIEQMSHIDELGPAYQSPVDPAVAKSVRRRGVDWAVLVVTFALGCTFAWIYVLFWAAVRAFRMVLS